MIESVVQFFYYQFYETSHVNEFWQAGVTDFFFLSFGNGS